MRVLICSTILFIYVLISNSTMLNDGNNWFTELLMDNRLCVYRGCASARPNMVSRGFCITLMNLFYIAPVLLRRLGLSLRIRTTILPLLTDKSGLLAEHLDELCGSWLNKRRQCCLAAAARARWHSVNAVQMCRGRSPNLLQCPLRTRGRRNIEPQLTSITFCNADSTFRRVVNPNVSIMMWVVYQHLSCDASPRQTIDDRPRFIPGVGGHRWNQRQQMLTNINVCIF